MANQVYANGREVSCKSGSGKSICAFPDVCFTPPLTPATPPGVPIPYPNTGMTTDTTSGSKTVKITGKEVMLKNKSYFSTSTGDEAGCAPKKGVVTSMNKGKVYFNAWSMDVKIEGENVVRHLDITTHNHASFPGNSPTWPFLDAADFAEGSTTPCAELAKKVKDACVGKEGEPPKGFVKFTQPARKGAPVDVKRFESMDKMCEDGDCREAMKCVVSPYAPNNCCPEGGKKGAKKPTPHHIVPKSQFHEMGKENSAIPLASGGNYNPDKAPCICVSGEDTAEGDHGDIHAKTNTKTRKAVGVAPRTQIPDDKRWTVGQAEEIGAQSVCEVLTECDPKCIQNQVRKGHEGPPPPEEPLKVQTSDEVRPTTAGREETAPATGPAVGPGS